MENNIAQEVQKVIASESAKRLAEENNKLELFEKASANFEELIKRGLAKNRGYNLLTIDKAHLHKTSFNISNL